MKSNKRLRKMPISAKIMLVLLLVYVVSVLFVYLWGVFTSLKTEKQFMNQMVFPTLPLTFANYSKSLDLFTTRILKGGRILTIGFGGMLKNSLVYCFLCGIIGIGTTWVVAYVTAAYPWKSSKFIYSMVLVVMTIPIVGSMPSSLMFYKALGLYDTWGYVCLSSIGFVGSNYLILHAFMSGLSRETREAAEIDGAGRFTIMLKIAFPQTTNILSILLTTSFIGHWNSYMPMVVWLPSKPSLMYGMYRFSTNSTSGARWPNVQMAGAMILMAPVLTLFILFKDNIIGGVKVSVSK